MITVTSATNKYLLGSNIIICLELGTILTNAQERRVNTANKESDLRKRESKRPRFKVLSVIR